jgi:hypothetical protein
MLFRTEDEEDVPRRRRTNRLEETRTMSIDILRHGAEDVYRGVDEDEEDTPGLFKRVTIRLAKLPRNPQTSESTKALDLIDVFFDFLEWETLIPCSTNSALDMPSLDLGLVAGIPQQTSSDLDHLDWNAWYGYINNANYFTDLPPTSQQSLPQSTIPSSQRRTTTNSDDTPWLRDLNLSIDSTPLSSWDLLGPSLYRPNAPFQPSEYGVEMSMYAYDTNNQKNIPKESQPRGVSSSRL